MKLTKLYVNDQAKHVLLPKIMGHAANKLYINKKYIHTYIHTYIKKAPGEDGITAEIFKQTFKILPKSITAMYNGCLKNGIFPEIWKKAKIIPITKSDTQNSLDLTKYRPISLNIGERYSKRH